jgi:hypothetical protein
MTTVLIEVPRIGLLPRLWNKLMGTISIKYRNKNAFARRWKLEVLINLRLHCWRAKSS